MQCGVRVFCVAMLLLCANADGAFGGDYLPFLALSGNSTVVLNSVDDGASQGIEIPLGFRLQDGSLQDRVYVATNGILSFGSSFTSHQPSLFSATNPESNIYLIAPFWSDVNTGIAGTISYATYNTSGGPTAVEVLEQVSSFIRETQDNSDEFSARWMLVAFWDEVAEYGGSGTETNSFQAVLITNSTQSYAIFTYQCGLMEWSDEPTVVGYRVATDYANHPLSGNDANSIACLSGNWTNLVYQLHSTAAGYEEMDEERCEESSLNVSRYQVELYGSCVPFQRGTRETPCDILFRENIDYIYVPSSRISLSSINRLAADTTVVINLISPECQEEARKVLCTFYYPTCGNNTHFEPPRSICSETCIYVRDIVCPIEWEQAELYFRDPEKDASLKRYGMSFINCSDTGEALRPLQHCCFDAGVDITSASTSATAPSTVSTVFSTVVPEPTSTHLPTFTTSATNSMPTPSRRDKVSSDSTTIATIIAVVVVFIMIVVLTVLAGAVCWWKYSMSRKKPLPGFAYSFSVPDSPPATPTSPGQRYWREDGSLRPPEPPNVSRRHARVTSGYLRQMAETNHLIPARHITLLDSVGKGEFGVVYRAHLVGWQDRTTPELVAVKTLKAMFTLDDVNAVVDESLKMKAFDHPHVLTLIGVSIDAGEAPYIVMPYMANGSLLAYLRRERPNLTTAEGADEEMVLNAYKRLLSMCLQIAKGMEYLAAERFVHRDLAARNCMIDADCVIKVADFGLSEDIYARNYFKQGSGGGVKLPVRWMAIESLQDGVFTEKTDVWSFGVTCWEVFTLGRSPYPGVEPFELLKHLESGRRLEKPYNTACSSEVYDILLRCWVESPDERPKFKELVSEITKMLESIAGYLTMEFSAITGLEGSNGGGESKYDHLSAVEGGEGGVCLDENNTTVTACNTGN